MCKLLILNTLSLKANNALHGHYLNLKINNIIKIVFQVYFLIKQYIQDKTLIFVISICFNSIIDLSSRYTLENTFTYKIKQFRVGQYGHFTSCEHSWYFLKEVEKLKNFIIISYCMNNVDYIFIKNSFKKFCRKYSRYILLMISHYFYFYIIFTKFNMLSRIWNE